MAARLDRTSSTRPRATGESNLTTQPPRGATRTT